MRTIQRDSTNTIKLCDVDLSEDIVLSKCNNGNTERITVKEKQIITGCKNCYSVAIKVGCIEPGYYDLSVGDKTFEIYVNL